MASLHLLGLNRMTWTARTPTQSVFNAYSAIPREDLLINSLFHSLSIFTVD